MLLSLWKKQIHKNNLLHNNIHACISSTDYLLLLHGVADDKIPTLEKLIKDASKLQTIACYAVTSLFTNLTASIVHMVHF